MTRQTHFHEGFNMTLQILLRKISLWLNTWNIKTNAENKPSSPSLFLNGNNISIQSSVKYLGLHIDQRLTWKNSMKTERLQFDLKTKI